MEHAINKKIGTLCFTLPPHGKHSVTFLPAPAQFRTMQLPSQSQFTTAPSLCVAKCRRKSYAGSHAKQMWTQPCAWLSLLLTRASYPPIMHRFHPLSRNVHIVVTGFLLSLTDSPIQMLVYMNILLSLPNVCGVGGPSSIMSRRSILSFEFLHLHNSKEQSSVTASPWRWKHCNLSQRR